MQESFEQHLRRFPLYPLRALIRRRRMRTMEQLQEQRVPDLAERYERVTSLSNTKVMTRADWPSPLDKGS